MVLVQLRNFVGLLHHSNDTETFQIVIKTGSSGNSGIAVTEVPWLLSMMFNHHAVTAVDTIAERLEQCN